VQESELMTVLMAQSYHHVKKGMASVAVEP
jgi:hypothetical protein